LLAVEALGDLAEVKSREFDHDGTAAARPGKTP
jgi:hypothetical protein